MNSSAPRFSVVLLPGRLPRDSSGGMASLRAQTLQDFELISLGADADASVDGMAELSNRHVRAKFDSQHSGSTLAAALNAASALASGSYLTFLPGDDAYHPDRFDAFARVAALCPEFAWGFSALAPVDAAGRAINWEAVGGGIDGTASPHWRSPLDAIRDLATWNTLGTIGNLVVDVNLFERVGGFADLRYAYSWDLALRLSEVRRPFVVERALYRRRTRSRDRIPRRRDDDRRFMEHEAQSVARAHEARARARLFSGIACHVETSAVISRTPHLAWLLRLPVVGSAAWRFMRRLRDGVRAVRRRARG